MNNDLQTPLKVISNNIVHVTWKIWLHHVWAVNQHKDTGVLRWTPAHTTSHSIFLCK